MFLNYFCEDDLCQQQSKVLTEICPRHSWTQWCGSRFPPHSTWSWSETPHTSDCRSSSCSTDSSGLNIRKYFKLEIFQITLTFITCLCTLSSADIGEGSLGASFPFTPFSAVCCKSIEINSIMINSQYTYSQSIDCLQSQCGYQHRSPSDILSLSSRDSSSPTHWPLRLRFAEVNIQFVRFKIKLLQSWDSNSMNMVSIVQERGTISSQF